MKLKPIQMNAPIKGNNATKYAVSLGNEPEKTVQVQLTKLQADSKTRIAALQLDANNNVITSRILTGQGANAEFKFQSDGELWLTPLDGNMQAPTSNSFSVELDDAEVSLEEKVKKFKTIGTGAKTRSSDDV